MYVATLQLCQETLRFQLTPGRAVFSAALVLVATVFIAWLLRVWRNIRGAEHALQEEMEKTAQALDGRLSLEGSRPKVRFRCEGRDAVLGHSSEGDETWTGVRFELDEPLLQRFALTTEPQRLDKRDFEACVRLEGGLAVGCEDPATARRLGELLLATSVVELCALGQGRLEIRRLGNTLEVRVGGAISQKAPLVALAAESAAVLIACLRSTGS